MSRGFVREGDQEEIPMVLPRAFLPSGVPNYVTPEGLKLLQEEMETLKKERLEAGSNYVTKNYIDAKMRQLAERISSAILVDATKTDPDTISFGKYVRYNDKVIRIVGVDEANASKGLVSFISPIAKSLIGKKKGDKFEVVTPRRTEVVEIFDVMSQQVTETPSRRAETKQLHQENKRDTIDAPCGDALNASKSEFQNDTIDVSVQSPRRDALNASKSESLKDTIDVSVQSPCRDASNASKSEPSKDTFDVSVQSPCRDALNASTSASSPEFLPLVNEQGNIIGRALDFEIHNGNKLLHPAVHLHIYNTKKELVAQHCWHVAFGEKPEKMLKRKLEEIESHVETNGRMSQTIKPKFDKQYIRETKDEKELVSLFVAVRDRG